MILGCKLLPSGLSPSPADLCMVPQNLGTSDVTRPIHARRARWALAAVAVTALALGGCGRKGGLDLPPSVPQNAAGDPIQEEARAPGSDNLLSPAPDAPPVAGKGRKRRIIIDPLLD